MDAWDAVSDDRHLLADLLASLVAEDWSAPSLCSDWTVRDVAGHLLAMATTSKASALGSYLIAGCDLEVTNSSLLARATAGRSDRELVDALRASADSRAAPPGLRVDGVFAEVVTHIADIALALDRPVELPADHLAATLDYLGRRRKGNTRFTLTRQGRIPVLDGEARIAGLRLDASDIAWTSGDGPLVQGPAAALIAAIAGRTGALHHLSGDGVGALRRR